MVKLKPKGIETLRKHKQEGCRGLSEGSLWHPCRQDNTNSCTKQVYVSSLMTTWTRLFGWTPRLLFRYIPVEQNNDKYLFLIVMYMDNAELMKVL